MRVDIVDVEDVAGGPIPRDPQEREALRGIAFGELTPPMNVYYVFNVYAALSRVS